MTRWRLIGKPMSGVGSRRVEGYGARNINRAATVERWNTQSISGNPTLIRQPSWAWEVVVLRLRDLPTNPRGKA